MDQTAIPFDINKYTNGMWCAENGITPAEMPVMLMVNGQPWLEFMCTPEYIEALAVGFLYNEGLIASADDLAQLRLCPAGDTVDIWTIRALEKPVRWQRTSGCAGGMTAAGPELGVQAGEAPCAPGGMPEWLENTAITASRVNELVKSLYAAQDLHRRSGGVHASAISDGRSLLLSCEDIGRHNTLDKLAGRVLLEKIAQPRQVILTTGRISSEMLQKAARMGTAVLVSSSSPTSLAVQLADQWGMTLIGYAHGGHFKVYAHPERVIAQ